jgi:hypothetical protein
MLTVAASAPSGTATASGRPGTEQVAELYDVESGPHKFRNLTESPAYRDVRLKLAGWLAAGWRASLSR